MAGLHYLESASDRQSPALQLDRLTRFLKTGAINGLPPVDTRSFSISDWELPAMAWKHEASNKTCLAACPRNNVLNEKRLYRN